MSEPLNSVASAEIPMIDLKTEAVELAKLDMDQARTGLSKLPMMGPALWLYGRDPIRKFTFIADMDWLLLPPVILDQCQLFTKNDIPIAFFTWAFVSDSVDARLRSGISRLAPHEWKSGPHLWLLDVVSPFGSSDEMISTLLQGVLLGHSVNALLPDPAQDGKLSVRTWQAHMAPDMAQS